MNMTNKLCVITGANSGIGFETAKALAALGAYVIMVCRNEQKAEAARTKLIHESANQGIEIVLCDFAIQHDIREAARQIGEKYDQIDVLINNHGMIAKKREETVDGLEKTFAINHMGYFLFTKLLLDHIKTADSARIINVASEAHKTGTFEPDNLQLETGFNPMKAYGNSKLFNILFTFELAERLKGTGVTANCLHPGVVRTNFGRQSHWIMKLLIAIGRPFMVSPQKGASTSVFLATSDEVEGISGEYFKNRKPKRPSRAARNMDHARKLWEISEKLIN